MSHAPRLLLTMSLACACVAGPALAETVTPAPVKSTVHAAVHEEAPPSGPTMVIDAATGKITHEGGDPAHAAGAALPTQVETGDAADPLDRDTTLSQDLRIGPSPDTVRVAITRSASTSAAAKQQAQALVKRDALKKILQAQNPERAAALMASLTPDKIEKMVLKLDAADEESTVTTYRANLTLHYDPKQLQALLGAPLKAPPEASPVPMAVGAGQAALLIPVWEESGTLHVWEQENPWRKILSRVALQEGKGKIILPYGDPIDQLAISPAKLPTLSYTDVASLPGRYGAAEVLVAQASPVVGNGLNLTLVHLSPQGRVEEKKLITLPEGTPNMRDALMNKAASDLASSARQQFQTGRQAEIAAAAEKHTIRALAPITRAADWASMRKRLLALPMVEGLEPTEIGPEKVEMDLTFHGGADAFGQALKSAGIHVTPGPGKLLLGFYPVPN